MGRFLMQRWLPALGVVCAFLPGLAAAQAVAPASADDARAWLQRIHSAANSGNYRGTLVFSAGGSMSSSRVWHYCVGDQTWEKLESLDGRQRQVIRHNDDVHTIWPQSRLAVLEKRDALPGWQVTPQSVDPRVLEQYRLQREGASRVAGREADVLLLEPLDGLRYAQRLWADRSTGLMLRAEVLTPEPNRTVLESAAFSEVEIGIKPQPKTLMQAATRTEGYRVLRPRQQRVNLQDEGWTLARPVPGFQLTGCVKRELDSSRPAAEGSTVADPVLQAVFSDGLAHVSLFIEPYDARRHKREMQAHLGATSTVTLRRQDHWFTAVGDAPAATLKRIAESLDRRR
jgi:sigma-E factor negative regulatory protein RseB